MYGFLLTFLFERKDRMSKCKRIMTGFFCLFLGLMTACGSGEILMETGERAESGIAADDGQQTGEDRNSITESPEIKETLKDLIYVYVCGQVRTPGVYSLDEGSRLFEAVDLAGGILPEGDLTRINLAAVLADGQKIYIPSAAEAETMQDAEEFSEESEKSGDVSGQRVNINRASKETLMTLPGIGEAKAEAILAYRQAEGDFESPEALMNVPGIKEGVFAKIKDRIAID